MNAYHVQLVAPIETEPQGSYFSGKKSNYLYVFASSFEEALKAVRIKYPETPVLGITQANYIGLPVVVGE